ncbi:MAG: glycosyltransferase family 2 protein [Chloroflexi bacterium]|nr:glycosyltransferase family 2 protein [Chloroflexota bacterium]
MKISIIVPVYNEESTVQDLLEQVRNVAIDDCTREIIVVDDGSTDGTRAILADVAHDNLVRVFYHERNRGKGAAVQTGLTKCTGDIIIIQDADLEYDPQDFPRLLRPILSGKAKVVYGSRFLGEHKAMYFWHSVGNNFLTLVANVMFDTTLTDVETCYKVFTRDVATKLHLREPRWGFDPEITCQILKSGCRIYEVPISYAGREYNEGKKITWRDGFVVLWTLLRCRIRG